MSSRVRRIGVAFQFVFDPGFGLVQDLLRRIGITSPNFYQDPHWALFMVTATYIWKNRCQHHHGRRPARAAPHSWHPGVR